MAMERGTAAASEPARLLKAARRIVVKIGSSLLIGDSGDAARVGWLASVGADIAALRAEGKQVIVVSSGAVALGRGKLGLRRSARLDHKQAAAAAGQTMLMQAWDAAMAPHDVPTAQLLLTLEDSEKRRRWLNARATMEVLLAQSALPVINENDSVATDELRYGDNDRLSARVAQMLRADLLVLLSDVDGLYTGDPRHDPAAVHIPHVADVTGAIEAHAGGAAAAGVGSGGMRTKIVAARIAGGAGCATLIAAGHEHHPLRLLAEGARATAFGAHGSPARAYKQWIAGTLETAGTLVVDDGAARALAGGKSLLPAGVTAVEGAFERGSCLTVRTLAGAEIARGICAYTADEVRTIAGASSKGIEARLGYAGPDALIHRDDLVMLGS
ncbi:glutamate 5-kinase [Sphingosinicella sp. LHD-64]|uniref:glutamate 5-kinase n=1 Tax=Sphingosinicella sp. LHD-64 TaxID=3072139 RepID=UPI00280F4415|nr:glutamate 5-kinase [Sphingosinicella sp. LHD-64]MDQ8755568.1 glutamate 5-kinase [Sphingosinicella sp. LHD-64]